MRIAICGYNDEYDDLLELGWTKVRWRAPKGYQKVRSDGSHNGHREAVWFSPHCLPGDSEEPGEFLLEAR